MYVLLILYHIYSCYVQYASSIFFHRLLICPRSYGTPSLNSTTSRHPPRASWISSAPSSLIIPPYSPPTNTNCHHSSNTSCSQREEEVVTLRCWPYLYQGFGRFSLIQSPLCVRAASRLSLLCVTPVSMTLYVCSGIALLWSSELRMPSKWAHFVTVPVVSMIENVSLYYKAVVVYIICVLYNIIIIMHIVEHLSFGIAWNTINVFKRSILNNSLPLMLY